MAIVVQTVTTCELCGGDDIRQWAAEGYNPPVGWSEMVIRTRGDGAGWSNTGRPFDGVICPACTERMVQCIAAWTAAWKLVRDG